LDMACAGGFRNLFYFLFLPCPGRCNRKTRPLAPPYCQKLQVTNRPRLLEIRKRMSALSFQTLNEKDYASKTITSTRSASPRFTFGASTGQGGIVRRLLVYALQLSISQSEWMGDRRAIQIHGLARRGGGFRWA